MCLPIDYDVIPGLNREFAAERWKAVPNREWQLARGEAKAAILPDENSRIFGSDINHTALEVARKNIALAGLKNIHVQKLDLSEAQSRFDQGKIITNPPYGERLSERDEADQLILKLGKQYRDHFNGWDCYAISPNPKFEEYFGHKATKKRKLYNGPIQCNFFQYFKSPT
jgi:putative N6-adenine-specific DNA methylase